MSSRSGSQPTDGANGGARGQALPLMVFVMLLCCLLFWQVARLGSDAVVRTRLQAAADACALGAASAGRREAEHLAALNGVVLVGYQQEQDSVQVVVGSGRWQATATAAVVQVHAG